MNTEQIENIYIQLLDYWNQRNAEGMASLFSENGNVVGFDGSQMNQQTEIKSELEKVFESHKTSKYIWKIREIRFLNDSTAILRSVVGMIPPGSDDINADVNAIQSLIVVLESESWKIELFQNTPAKFDGRPELAEKLTNELRQLF